MPSWLGVDVGGKRKGFDVAVVDERRLIAVKGGLDTAGVLALVREYEPAVIAIDSPRCYAPAGHTTRDGERQLRRDVCGIRWTPDEEHALGGYYEWIREGLCLYEALATETSVEVVEVFPTASWTRWFGRRIGTRAEWTTSGLAALGLADLPLRTNQDERDAIAAAVTAREHSGGTTEAFGEIVVPCPARRPHHDRSSTSTPGWVLQELHHAGRENLDAAHVARYDAKEDASAASEVSLLRTLGMVPDSLVVELGAGTGQFTIAAATTCGCLIAVDISEPMLTRLATKVKAHGLENVKRPPADFVYSRFALHHLPDFWKAIALSRVRAIVKAGGVFRLWDVVYGFEPAEAGERIEAWCATGGESAEADWTRSELEEHVRDEYSTFTWLLEPMIIRSGFEITGAEHSDDGIFAKYLLRAV